MRSGTWREGDRKENARRASDSARIQSMSNPRPPQELLAAFREEVHVHLRSELAAHGEIRNEPATVANVTPCPRRCGRAWRVGGRRSPQRRLIRDRLQPAPHRHHFGPGALRFPGEGLGISVTPRPDLRVRDAPANSASGRRPSPWSSAIRGQTRRCSVWRPRADAGFESGLSGGKPVARTRKVLGP